MNILVILIFSLVPFKVASCTKKIYSNNNNITSNVSFMNPVNINGMTLEQFCVISFPNLPKGECSCRKFRRICELLQIANNDNISTTVHCTTSSYVKTVISTCLCTIGFIANLIIVLIAKRNWNNSVYCHKLIAGLALADLLFLVFTLMHCVPPLWTCGWIYNSGMCKFLYPAINMTATTGLGFVLIISIERYIGITHPFSRGMTSKKIYIIVSLNLLISIASVLPSSAVLGLHYSSKSCKEKWLDPNHSRIYTWVLFSTSFACPVLVISALYLSMLHQLRKSTTKSLRYMNTCDPVLSKRKRENQRVALIIFSLLISFVLFVSPNRIYWILNDEGIFNHFDRSVKNSARFWSDISYIFHAVINPIIYSIIDVKFRSSFKRFFRSSSSRSKSQYSSNVHSLKNNSTRVTTTTSLSDLSSTSNRSTTIVTSKMQDL